MLSNDQMVPNRFARMARVRHLQRAITETFTRGGTVQVATHLRVTNYRPKHADLFRFDRFSAYVVRGRHLDCIDFCRIRLFNAA